MSVQKLHDLIFNHCKGPGEPFAHAYARIREVSPNVTAGNFFALSASDIRRIFDIYDDFLFGGFLGEHLGGRITFAVSWRLTSSAGLLRFKKSRWPKSLETFEIAISGNLLIKNYKDDDTCVINGLECPDRLSALLRIFEHELTHLVEKLLTQKTSCRGKIFRSLARKLFGHTDVTHGLVTARSQSRAAFCGKVGDMVEFSAKGIKYTGRLNRITKRATVLVESPNGELYSDGRRYNKYYVPVGWLSLREA